MTPQGKADRAALRESVADAAEPATVPTEVRSAVEEVVLEVLQRDAIPGDRDLFDLGVTSLAFIRIVTQVNERFNVSLTGSELGDTASVDRLAAVVAEHVQNHATSAA